MEDSPDARASLPADRHLVTFTSLAGYGTTRFRHAAEMSLVVPAGVAAVYAWERPHELGSPRARARLAVRARRKVS